MNCPQCQQVLRQGARFCDGCGLSVSRPDYNETELYSHPEIPPQSDPFVGRVLGAKYQLKERLGEGGMGAVYRAVRLHIGDEVAVKILHQQFLSDAQAVERFRREARAAAQLQHPNIVSVYDYGEARGDGAPAYLVMELIRGESLGALLKREGRLAPERVVALMREVCAGVGAAHRNGIIHRDIKPDNIYVFSPDEGREMAKVLDFGLARLRDSAAGHTLTQTGVVFGTPYYLSPEQCRGEKLDARSDVYSLGVVLYYALSGARPFESDSLPGLIHKHLSEPPPALPEQLSIPPALEAVARRALSKNPDDRQQDATAFARELQAADLRPPTRATIPAYNVAASQGVSAERPARRRWVFILLPLGLVAALALLLLGSYLFIKKAVDDTSQNPAATNNNSISQPSQTGNGNESRSTENVGTTTNDARGNGNNSNGRAVNSNSGVDTAGGGGANTRGNDNGRQTRDNANDIIWENIKRRENTNDTAVKDILGLPSPTPMSRRRAVQPLPSPPR